MSNMNTVNIAGSAWSLGTAAGHNGTYSISGAVGASDNPLRGSGINIKLIPANGGTIISINHDPSAISDLYVIPESADISAELGKIITMHYLKKVS